MAGLDTLQPKTTLVPHSTAVQSKTQLSAPPEMHSSLLHRLRDITNSDGVFDTEKELPVLQIAAIPKARHCIHRK